MARIRTIKPSFWGSPTIAALSRDARLLALGLTSYADDDGRFLAATNAINGFVFPNDDLPPARVRKWINECEDVGFIHLYKVDGVLYGCIPTWHLHQVIGRYTPSLLPEPDIEYARRGGASLTERAVSDSVSTHGGLTYGSGIGSGSGSGSGINPPLASLVVAHSDDDESPPPPGNAIQQPDPETAQALVAEWLDHTTTRPPSRVVGQVAKELKLLLDDGQPPDDVRAGLAAWARKGLHPSTLASVVHETRTPKPARNGTAIANPSGVDWDAAFARAAQRDQGQR